MQRIILVIIILVAIALRFIGTNPGYPPIHEDEGITHSQGIAMILEHSLNPRDGYGLPYNYPIIVPLVNAIFYGMIFIPVWTLGYLLFHFPEVASLIINGHFSQIGGIFEQNILGFGKINVVFWGRYVTAFFGVLVVWLSYKFGKRLFRSDLVGILGAFFVAINYRQVLNSHFGLPDIYNALFLLLALYQINKLWEKPVAKNYLLTGLITAVYFSTKFQLFVLPPLAIVLFFLIFQQKNRLKWIKMNVKNIFFYLIVVLVLTTLFLNTFHFLHWRETLEQVGYTSLKYRSGRLELDFYSISYLYQIGIGPTMSFLSIVGVLCGLIYKLRQTVFLLSVVIPFLLAMVYFTGGGFYTRNFVTITPILLVFSSLAVSQLWKILKNYSKVSSFLVCLLLISLLSFESLSNSLVVPWEYSQTWNVKLLQKWLGYHIPLGSVMIADSSIPLPIQKVKLVKAEKTDDYFLAELQNKGVNFAVINLSLFQDHFFWWMLGDTAETLKFWQKPTTILNNTPLAKMLFELKKYVVFEALNPWQAPDGNFLVVKIPNKMEFNQGQIIYADNFDNKEWAATNDGFGDLSNLSKDQNFGLNRKGALKISSSGKRKYSQRFVSKKIPTKSNYLYKIRGWVFSPQTSEAAERSGFIGIDFLSEDGRVVDVALSDRSVSNLDWSPKEFLALAPENAKFLQIFFQTISTQSTFWLDDLEVWESTQKIFPDKEGYIDSRFSLEEHLFLNSNGGM